MVRGYHIHIKQLSSNVKLFLAGNAIQGIGLSIYALLFNLYLKKLGYGESSIGNLINYQTWHFFDGNPGRIYN